MRILFGYNVYHCDMRLLRNGPLKKIGNFWNSTFLISLLSRIWHLVTMNTIEIMFCAMLQDFWVKSCINGWLMQYLPFILHCMAYCPLLFTDNPVLVEKMACEMDCLLCNNYWTVLCRCVSNKILKASIFHIQRCFPISLSLKKLLGFIKVNVFFNTLCIYWWQRLGFKIDKQPDDKIIGIVFQHQFVFFTPFL